jgi:dipeptidyl aminopeptidase/acylaminoacyl peptidase
MPNVPVEVFPYGEWPSPISAADVAKGHIRLSFPQITGSTVWWQETKPAEGGRQTVVRQGPDGARGDLLPPPWNARTRVHEYGGRSYQPLPDGGMAFANFADQRLYRVPAGGGDPKPVTADTGDRFADFVVSPAEDELWCIREQDADGRITRAIVAVPLDGSAVNDADAIRVLVTGSDFFACPTPSPDGRQLAWICWDHPRMPWDGTELRVASLDSPAEHRVLMGGPSESVLDPVWRDDGSLYAMSDRSGWWNPYLVDLSGAARNLCPREEEFAGPLWQLGARTYAMLADGRLAVVHGSSEPRLAVLDPASGELTDVDVPWRIFGQPAASGQRVAGLAGGAATPMSVVTVDTGSAAILELRREADSMPEAGYLPVPRTVELPAPGGGVVHAVVYPPGSPAATGPEGDAPPYIVWVHGGPTALVHPLFDLEKAYFTSRGIGVVDVNYGGSTGYGRAYRERLRGQWGIVDVADCAAAALALADAGEADGKRLGIRGGSAGGWTALAAVTSGAAGVYAAVVSYYGVTDLREFAEQTHDFESRYLDGLIGPLPASEQLYVERAPVGHVSSATCPILLLQGLDDPVVPPAQAASIAADLSAHGIPYGYLTFEGESHGFRKAETIVTCLEAELSFYGQIMGFTPPGVPPLPLNELGDLAVELLGRRGEVGTVSGPREVAALLVPADVADHRAGARPRVEAEYPRAAAGAVGVAVTEELLLVRQRVEALRPTHDRQAAAGHVVADRHDVAVPVTAVDAELQAAGDPLDRLVLIGRRADGEEGEVIVDVRLSEPGPVDGDAAHRPDTVRSLPSVPARYEHQVLPVVAATAVVDAVRGGEQQVEPAAVHHARGAEVFARAGAQEQRAHGRHAGERDRLGGAARRAGYRRQPLWGPVADGGCLRGRAERNGDG